MYKFVLALTSLAALAACASVPAHAQQPCAAKVMVLADDEDPDSVPMSNDIHYRIGAELRKAMLPTYCVLDNSSVLASLGDWELPNRMSRTRKIAFAKAACSDGDSTTCPRFLVFVKARARVVNRDFGSEVTTRLQGDVIDIRNNTVLGNYQPIEDKATGPRDCDDFCRDEVIGKRAYDIAAELGQVLKIKLDPVVRGGGAGREPPATSEAPIWTEYKVTVRGFTEGEAAKMQGAMDEVWDNGAGSFVAPSKETTAVRSWNYRSRLNDGQIRGQMIRLLLELGYDEKRARVSVAGREVTVENLFPN